MKFNGGRESMRHMHLTQEDNEADYGQTVIGTLKGYDQLMNLVLDDVKELLRGTQNFQTVVIIVGYAETDASTTDDEGNESSRSLGLIVARGTLLVLVSPVDGSEEIANPFVQADE